MTQSSPLNIQSATVVLLDGYRALELVVDGITTHVDTYSTKLTVRALGYVSLGVDFEDRLPEIHLPADPSIGRGPTTLYGFSDDPQLLALFDDFVAHRFTIGQTIPLPWPPDPDTPWTPAWRPSWARSA